MKDPKVWQIFQKLLPEEIRGLEQELKKDSSLQGTDLLLLFRLFKKADRNKALPRKEQLARKVISGNHPDYSEEQQMAYLNKLLSQLRVAIEQFVVLRRLQENEQLWGRQLLHFYLSRDLDAFFSPLYKQLFQPLHETRARTVDYFQDAFELEALGSLFRNKRKDAGIEDRYAETFLAHEDAFLHQKMYHMVLCLSFERNLGIRMPSLFDDADVLRMVDRRLELFEEEESPFSGYSDTLAIYRNLYALITGGESVHSEKIRQLLVSKRDRLDPDEFREMYSMLRNYYIGLANETRDVSDYKKLYEVFLESILQDFALFGAVPHNILKGLIISAIRAGQLAEAEADLDRIFAMLPEGEDREELLAFNKARILFEKGDWPAVVALLGDESGNPRKFKEPFYDITGRIILLQCWYEMLMERHPQLPEQLRSDRDLERRAETERRYLNRVEQSISEENHKGGFRNFFRLYSKLVTRTVPEEFVVLAAEIGETRPLAEPEWLLAKAEAGNVLPLWFGNHP